MAKIVADKPAAKGINVTWLHVAVTFITELLGSTNQNPNLMRDHVTPEDIAAEKKAQEQRLLELQAMSEAERRSAEEADAEKQMTVFYRFNGAPFYFDYVAKGFMKDNCRAMAKIPGSHSEQLSGFLKLIDGPAIHVAPRLMMFQLPEGAVIGKITREVPETEMATPTSGIWPPQNAGRCDRPLRVSGPQGERVALVSSETLPPGTKLAFYIRLQNPAHEKVVREWFAQGVSRGFGQWRNSGKGRFTAVITKLDESVFGP